MEEGEPANANNFRLYVAEGDSCFRLGLFQKAINSYTAALDIRMDRNVLIARSRSYASLGMNDEAIKDATDSVGTDGSFYRGYYQLGQAYFVAGLFEEALVYYYRAYRKRPDIQEYRLGVQKAEESILRAIDTGIVCSDQPPAQCNPAPTVAQIEEIYQSVEFPLSKAPGTGATDGLTQGSTQPFRCLCGCPHCDPRTCGDLQVQEFAPYCSCRCSACLHHLAYKHNQILDPVSNTLVAVSSVLDDANHTDSAMLSPHQTSGPSRLKQSSLSIASSGPQGRQESLLEKEFRQEQRMRRKYKTAGDLAPDRAFLETLQQDATLLQTCGNIKPLVSSGIDFLEKRSEFWRQQAHGTAQSAQTVTGRKAVSKSTLSKSSALLTLSKKVPQPLSGASQDRATSQLSALRTPGKKTVQNIVALMQHIQIEIEAGDFDTAMNDAKLADQFASDLRIRPDDHQAYVEREMLIADIQTCIGCILYDIGKPGVSVQRFRHALTINTAIGDVRGTIRCYRNLGKVFQAIGDYQSAKLAYSSLLEYSDATSDGGELVCPRILVAEACINAAKCIIDADLEGNAFDHLVMAFDILSAGTYRLGEPVEDVQLQVEDPMMEQFRVRAPSFFATPDQDPTELALDALCLAGKYYYGAGDIGRSQSLFELCRAKARELRDTSAEKAALINLRFLALQQGNTERAEAYQQEMDMMGSYVALDAPTPEVAAPRKKGLTISV
ncbi:putative Dynein binding protein [Giardia muris]|uniref:Outer dynein arm-docking complex subunit 4 n=1 Tax=Giardia muris TaxID=5742 RepID=A0A4Z1T8U6_GIAMU|nr:putative Dynein binding protein [Giardia muris]|eukprot:TNJ29557.1 putative Dynein binding protein [Giardia muris]